ncbi:MAG: membrane protein insertase YidC [Gammaproteobacteria bacterium]|nr:membrane protein insertase YidC [Gammaproteobacteria bacterium]MCW8924581.1 membrane protein insertase YidC [Gammaproteobacteria bacterium]
MENQRTLLYFTLFFVIYLLWAQWQIDYGPKPEPVVETASQEQPVPIEGSVPAATTVAESGAAMAQQPAITSSQTIKVITDVLDIEINTRGGDIRKAILRQYAVDAEKPEQKVELLTDSEINFHIAQSGLVSANQETAPTHNAIYSAEQDTYRLAEGVDEIKVPLHWVASDGSRVTKLYTFRRNDYTINVDHNVTAGQNGWSGSQYMQLMRTRPSTEGESAFIHTYSGGVIYNEEIKYEKIDFDDIQEENLKTETEDGWLAMIQHYFLTAWIPESEGKNLYFSSYIAKTDRYILGTRSSAKRLMPNEQAQFNSRFVVGPKLQYKLGEIEPGLELTVDYGVFTIIAKPLFWLLNLFHSAFGNWGWAIIFLTITVKALFYKLSEMSYKSMAKMRVVAPRMKQMKEQYGSDRQAMSKAMMELYKREKINPMGGCFPILVQIPVFISLYWVLLESVEMRHAPFALWLDNLSAMDPYFVLPVIMGASMFVQQKLNPAPMDPMQQKIFQIMPFAFTFMFAFFPSGLVLYWVVNNILSIAQQYVITKRIENEKK